ncbi:MAG: porin [Burkholderiaceae bacterium]
MKKSLIAVAVAAALPAAAFAQSNVTLYGIGDVAITSKNSAANAGAGSSLGLQSGIQSGSRWGVQGQEDLGGGLAATFQFESAIGVDDGTGNDQFARQSRVGLKGGFGELRFGRQYTPIFWSSIAYDQTGFGLLNNHVGIAGSAVRWSNSIEYRNSFGPIRAIVGYAFDESPGGKEDGFGVGLNYSGGAFGAGLGYHDEGNNKKVLHVGGEFKVGAFALGLNYGASDLGAAGGAGDRTDIDLSLGLKVGASGMIFLNVLNKEVEGNLNDVLGLGLSYTHNMSKRTNWYASLGMDRVDNADDPRTIAIGIRHKF